MEGEEVTSERFLKIWFLRTVSNTINQAYGWVAVFASLGMGAVVSIFPKFGPVLTSHPLANSMATAVVCLILALSPCAVLALYQASRILHPLKVRVTHDLQSPGSDFNDQIRGHNVTAIVHNQSVEHLKDCVAYITNVPRPDGSTEVRMVERFDLPPKSKRNVFVAYWYSRQPPAKNDEKIGLNGPPGNCNGGNVRWVLSGSELHIRIHVPEAESKTLRCRVWIDDRTSSLKVVSLTN